MTPDLIFWLSLALKMGVTAGFVVVASLIAERSSAMIGAMVSTLPLSAGPAYVMLSLDHDAAFIAQSALSTVAVNVATAVFAFIYVVLAQRRALAVALPLALLVWFAMAALTLQIAWTPLTAALANIVACGGCGFFANRYAHAAMVRARRRWFDVPLRAGLVAMLIAVLVLLSSHVGPALSGIIAPFPIVLSSLMLILHDRIGGPAAAAVLANSILGLAGFSAAALTLSLTAQPLGTPIALALALCVSIIWNVSLWLMRRKRVMPDDPVTAPASLP